MQTSRVSITCGLVVVAALFPSVCLSQIGGTSPRIASVLNAASYASGSVAPGEIVVIFGSGVGPAILASGKLNAQGLLDSLAGETRVLFDGVAAPLLYASAGQTSVIVPYAVAGRDSTAMVVEYRGVSSNSFLIPVSSAAPAIFTTAASGSGQGAILNQDLTINSATNPSVRGSVAVAYATGEGQTNPAGVDGLTAGTQLPAPRLAVTAKVGGIDAQVLYAGAAPSLVAGVLQVNMRVPENVTPGTAVPVQITIGGIPSQSGVTMAVGAPTVITLERVSAPFPVVSPGDSFDITVALNRPAGSGGMQIALSSGDPALPVPSQVRIGPGSYKSTFTVRVGSIPSARIVQITAVGGGTTKSLSLNVNPMRTSVVLGGGMLTASLRTSGEFALSSSAADYIRQLIDDVTNPSYGDLFGMCGRAASARNVEVLYDPDFVHGGGSNDDPEAPLVLRQLPHPDSSGTDSNFDGPFIHEYSHELRWGSWNKLFQTFQYDPRGPYAEEEGFANACEGLVNHRLFATGRRKSAGNGSGGDKTLLLDSVSRLGGDVLGAPTLGGVSQFSAYLYPAIIAGQAAYQMLASKSSSAGGASLAPFEASYFSRLTSKQSPLSPADRGGILDALGFLLDGIPPSVWFEKLHIMTLNPEDLQTPGLKVAIVSGSVNPADVYVQVVRVEADVKGLLRWSPVMSGPVTIRILDTKGADVQQPLQTDLAAIGGDSPVRLSIPGSAGNGAFTIVAAGLVNGTAFEKRIPVAKVPGELVEFPDKFAGLYAVISDESGNVADMPFSVSGGTVVWQGPGAIIVGTATAGPSVITINGKAFDYPKPFSRLVAVPSIK